MAQAKQQSSVIEVECPTSTSQEVHTARSQCQPPSETPSDSAVIHYLASPPRIDVAERAEIMGSSPKANSEVVKPERKVMKSYFTLSDWWWELLSWMIGTLSLLTMLLLLALFHNKSTATWHSKLSINAMVSALAQTSQTSLAVSLNSGIGQLKWDWLRTRRQKRDIDTFDGASRGPLGSLVLVWKQLFGTMKMHVATIGALATILLIAFSTFSQQAIGISEHNSISDAQQILRGVLEGLFRDKISYSEIQGHCSGERCVWERYNSLAICAYTSPPVTNVTFTCMTNYTDCVLNEAVNPAYNTISLQTMAQIMFGESINFQMWSPDRESYAVSDTVDIYFSIDIAGKIGDQLTEKSLISFLKITFEVCVHTYQTTIHGSQIETKLLRQGPALTRDPNWLPVPDEDASGWFNCGMIEDIYACVDHNNVYDASIPLRYLTNTILYGEIDRNVFVSWINFEMIEEDGFEKIAARMKNMAVSMTNGMRRFPLSAEMIDGIVETSQPYFRVSIPWLILPMAIWLCTSIFLLCTILLTEFHGVPAWKSSPLVLLDCKQQGMQLDSDRLVRNREKLQPAMVVLEDGRLVETQ